MQQFAVCFMTHHSLVSLKRTIMCFPLYYIESQLVPICMRVLKDSDTVQDDCCELSQACANIA